jgi:hypothetical protein
MNGGNVKLWEYLNKKQTLFGVVRLWSWRKGEYYHQFDYLVDEIQELGP